MNLVILSGRLTDTPELRRYNEEGDGLVNFTIAVNEEREKANFINCVAWKKTAEKIAQLYKGDFIAIIGKIENNTYKDKTGATKYSVKVTVRELVPNSKSESLQSGGRGASETFPTAEFEDYGINSDLPF